MVQFLKFVCIHFTFTVLCVAFQHFSVQCFDFSNLETRLQVSLIWRVTLSSPVTSPLSLYYQLARGVSACRLTSSSFLPSFLRGPRHLQPVTAVSCPRGKLALPETILSLQKKLRATSRKRPCRGTEVQMSSWKRREVIMNWCDSKTRWCVLTSTSVEGGAYSQKMYTFLLHNQISYVKMPAFGETRFPSNNHVIVQYFFMLCRGQHVPRKLKHCTSAA